MSGLARLGPATLTYKLELAPPPEELHSLLTRAAGVALKDQGRADLSNPKDLRAL